MRPLRLTMSAFGPYASSETIDFTNLKDKNIFLITGPTGAGKTTIFDAISYALFGEASGSSRDKDSLRSDFALPETVTYIELEFELRGQKYIIMRSPQQERKKVRGEGFVTKNAEAQLTLPDGDIVTKWNAVDEKIGTILGINKSQFRQIVMLPQGEFRELLESESKDREIIFRRIFGTEAFEAIQRKLDEQMRTLSRKISDTITKRDTNVRHIEAGDNELLNRLINAENINIVEVVNKTEEAIEIDENTSSELNKEIKKLKLEQEKMQKNIVEGEEINKKLKEKIELENSYEIHLSREVEYKKKQIELELARKAQEVRIVEDSLKDRQKNLEMRKLQYNDAENKQKEAERALLLCKEQLMKEEARETERRQLADSIANLKAQEDKVKVYEEKNSLLAKLRVELSSKEKSINQLRITIKDNKLQLEGTNKELTKAQQAETEKEKLHKIVFEKELLIKEMRELYKLTDEYLNKLKIHQKEAADFDEFDKKYVGFKAHYELMEDKFRKGQAGILAMDLREGIPCPVCGSPHHPQPAKLIDGVPTEDDIKEAKLQFESLKEDREKKLQILSDLNGMLTTSKQNLFDKKEKLKSMLGEELISDLDNNSLKQLALKGKELSEELKKLKEEQEELLNIVKQKNILEENIKKVGDDITNREKQLQELEQQYTYHYGKVKGEEELAVSIEKEIPIELRSSSKLSLRIKMMGNELDLLEKALKLAQENYNKASSNYASSETDKKVRAKNIEEAEKEVEDMTAQLTFRVKEAGFADYDEYASLIMSKEDIKLLEQDITKYREELKSLKDRLEKIKKDTEELKEIDLDNLKISLENFKQKQEQLELEGKNIFSRINNNKKALEEIEEINKSINEEEAKYSVIGELSRIANGDNNEKITFERYVLAAYFDEIINAANIRLNRMAGGRFILKRKEDKGKGRKQSGLELEVFDNYTGKSRHVKTLSGGESFKASLALALGLADVVQAHAGGISLDTMFVDEGFGTLDPESLDNAIQCLIDLQKGGRLVGIISHVPELKERIDSRLEVTPAKEGSKARFIM
ncbi:MAG: AAA family ATPase [Bacillota bacterium]|nr:AAA family ATPase [Bacillota bacterium]